MSVMVTGIGFVGGYVVRDLLAAGEDVVLFGFFGGSGSAEDALPDLVYLERLLGAQDSDRISVVVGDICDLPLLLKTIDQYDVRSIVHLASLMSESSEADIPRAVRVNIDGTVNMFEAAVQRKLERVVWASSINVFGPRSLSDQGVISDDSPIDPSTVYGVCKAFLEGLGRRYYKNHGANVVGLRLSRVYGFGEHVKASRGSGSSWLSNLLEIPATGREPAIVPFGERSMDFQYVEDVSDAFVRAIKNKGGGGETYLTNGDYRPISDAFAFVRKLLPDADIVLTEGSAAAGLAPGAQTNWAYHYDSRRASDDLGIRRRFSMEAGFYRTIRAYREFAGLTEVREPAEAAISS
ncbi:NAD-dependent epimerase/dehydratase family protein [Arthrobacter sp. FW306-2-2C-D06B]|jgi:nucleoside-diphosphate-sugar epimerase|uniref:NAD-dependent epimerase/dehydratase family protein n=1 Tax=Arthrobacter sp. FW306-2-2C-D06B TaxID=2879618 RepID=UPI001F351ED1|nr:NAD(P)-dependent oxidoreductase [Arthrobacter sp. FW306-2-2C-D06B]UKA60492.1 NAD(P)-dependent oxidoreductase [Arthrobacter sp. FW306-2-2C-D06B]